MRSLGATEGEPLRGLLSAAPVYTCPRENQQCNTQFLSLPPKEKSTVLTVTRTRPRPLRDM